VAGRYCGQYAVSVCRPSRGPQAWCQPRLQIQGASGAIRQLSIIVQHYGGRRVVVPSNRFFASPVRASRAAERFLALWEWLAQILPKFSWTSTPSQNPRRQARFVRGWPEQRTVMRDLETISGSSPANIMTPMRQEPVFQLSESISACCFCSSSA
jgi:hypothetical protein